jgi:transposase-like protein
MNHWMRIMQERVSSGERINEFCESRGSKRHTFFYWQRKLRETAGEELARQQDTTGQPGMAFAEIRMTNVTQRPSVREESGQLFADVAGVRIKVDSGYPTSKLAALLRELIRQC